MICDELAPLFTYMCVYELQGYNFSLISEATDTMTPPPPIACFGLLLNGCYLPEYVSFAPAIALNSDATHSWRLTLTQSLSNSNSSHVEMNGWWVVPGHHQAGADWRVQVADKEESKGCLGRSCSQWRLAATSAAVTTWSGHLDLAFGTWQPVVVRDNRWLYDLLVRPMHGLNVSLQP